MTKADFLKFYNFLLSNMVNRYKKHLFVCAWPPIEKTVEALEFFGHCCQTHNKVQLYFKKFNGFKQRSAGQSQRGNVETDNF